MPLKSVNYSNPRKKSKMVGWVKTTLLFSFLESCAWVKFVRDEGNKYKFIHDLPTE